MRALCTGADGRNECGQFKRSLDVWDGSQWDAGWIDNRGRFRVYRPDYPRAYAGGYALRAHVVWWLARGVPHAKGTDLHHHNGIKTDDRLDNLQQIGHGEHSRRHKALPPMTLQCRHCGRLFVRTAKKVRSRIREGIPIKYCSQRCYHNERRGAGHRQVIASGLQQAYADDKR